MAAMCSRGSEDGPCFVGVKIQQHSDHIPALADGHSDVAKGVDGCCMSYKSTYHSFDTGRGNGMGK